MRQGYTPEELEFLRSGFLQLRVAALTKAFNKRFGQARTLSAIRSTLKREGFKCGRAPGFLKGERLTYTPEQVRFIKDNFQRMSRAQLTEAFNQAFGESKTVQQITAFTKNQKIRSGRTGHFEKGHVPWTAGMAGTGAVKPNSGSFQKGQVPANIEPLGHERLDTDGSVLVKIAEPNPYTGAPTRYKHKRLVVWEAANGPVPKGYVVRHLDGDKSNCALGNLGLFTKAESLRMSQLGFSDVPTEIKPTVIAMAKLDTKRFELTREVGA